MNVGGTLGKTVLPRVPSLLHASSWTDLLSPVTLCEERSILQVRDPTREIRLRLYTYGKQTEALRYRKATGDHAPETGRGHHGPGITSMVTLNRYGTGVRKRTTQSRNDLRGSGMDNDHLMKERAKLRMEWLTSLGWVCRGRQFASAAPCTDSRPLWQSSSTDRNGGSDRSVTPETVTA